MHVCTKLRDDKIILPDVQVRDCRGIIYIINLALPSISLVPEFNGKAEETFFSCRYQTLNNIECHRRSC